jgi:excisionase family DNA binding protein
MPKLKLKKLPAPDETVRPVLAGLRPKKPVPSEAVTITVEEAATRLRIGRNQAYEAVRRGDIPAIRVGARWLVPTIALERLLRCEPKISPAA